MRDVGVVEIRLLGRLEVVRDGVVVELPPSKKARALLAFLVATGRAHERGYLASLLWDEREDERAALRWALSRLRPIVDESDFTRLNTDRDRVSFERRGADVDLTAVRSALREGIDRVDTATLEQAATRFRGTGGLLDGLDLPECYGFHAWCTAEREAARALRTSILSLLVERLAADEPERALPHARSRLDIDPLAGAAQASVVRILAVLGREREADELYQGFRQMAQSRNQRISVELERARALLRATSPAPTTAREAAAREVGPSRGGGAREIGEIGGARVVSEPAALERLARSPFVGREREIETLTGLLDTAFGGSGAFVEIVGEAGLGKTRLAEELAHHARLRGGRVLVGRCLEGEGSPPFLPFLDSIDVALGDDDARGELEKVIGADAALAARLSPRLAARLRVREAATAAAAAAAAAVTLTDAASERYLVFQAVAILLERIAAPAGAVLIVEDLHWIDQPSLALLRYLAPRLETMRLLIIATYRDEDLNARQRDALVDLRRHTGSARVALKGLAIADIDALVTALSREEVPRPLRQRLAEATAGHPLFLQEILKHLIEENALGADHSYSPESFFVPEGVRQVISRRLARLSDPARQLLTVAAPMRGAFTWELVREVSTSISSLSTNEDTLLDALEEVLAAQLLRENVPTNSTGSRAGIGIGSQTTYELSHALVAQTLNDALPVPRRSRLNRQIGEAIERIHQREAGATSLDPHLDALAQHFFLAADSAQGRAKAADYAIRAADRATSLLAFEEAARHYQRAIDLLENPPPAQLAELHRRRGRALVIVSAWNEACESFEHALATDTPPPANNAWRAEVLVELGAASVWAMNMPAVYTRARSADELVGSLGREDLTLAVGGMFAQCLASEGQIDQAIDKYAELRQLRGARHVPSMALAPLTYYWNGRIAEALTCADETLTAARSANDIVSLLIGLPPLGMSLAASGRYREASAAFAEARAIGERHRATLLLARAVSMSTGMHLDLGDVDAAEDLATEARELSKSSGWFPGEISAGIDLVVCRLRRGDIGTAASLIEEIARDAAENNRRRPGGAGFHEWLWAIRMAWARAEVSAAKGDDAEAVDRWSAEALKLSEGGRPKYTVATLVTRAADHASPKRGRTKEALADLDRAIEIARTSRDPALKLRAIAPRQALEGTEALAKELDETRVLLINR